MTSEQTSVSHCEEAMASCSNSVNLHFQYLKGEKYDYWCIKMKTSFRFARRLGFHREWVYWIQLYGSSLRQSRRAVEKNKKTDAKAVLYIKQRVGDTILGSIECWKAKEAWDIIPEEFQGSVRVKLLNSKYLERKIQKI